MPLSVSGLPAEAPLSVSAKATADRLIVELALEPEWHVYARDVGGGKPVALRLAEDSDFVARGAPVLPPDTAGKLEGKVVIRQAIERRGTGNTLRATLEFMVCDPLACLPPMAVTLTGRIGEESPPPVAVLLVVDAADERSARIRSFLGEQGFEVDLTTYAEVTAADCESHAVVLADSKLFGEMERSVLDQVRRFPRSETPIVAVGFLGTELIEAQGIAMTSGYI